MEVFFNSRLTRLLEKTLHKLAHPERKPVGIGTWPGGQTMVVCDDGSVWVVLTREWAECPPIPGTRQAKLRIMAQMARQTQPEREEDQ